MCEAVNHKTLMKYVLYLYPQFENFQSEHCYVKTAEEFVKHFLRDLKRLLTGLS